MKRRISILAILGIAVVLTACDSGKPAETTKKAATEAPLPTKATAIFETTEGKMTCDLYPQDAPKNVANFIGLAEGTREWKAPGGRTVKFKLYDGTVFHRVIPGFMIQGGDPAGNGAGGPGYSVEDEIKAISVFNKPGVLAMANEGPNTNGSQFFITEAPAQHLNGKFTVIGQCDAATVALVKKIAREPRDKSNDRPFHPVKIEKLTIEKQ
jgi:peptidyl-prolyl cis-trans isomerase A (cyclophilin A)